MRKQSRRSFLKTIVGAAGLMLLSSVTAAGATYYISPSGLDTNAGTNSAPWKTFNHAVQRLRPGDMLTLKDGVYTRTVTGMLSVDCRTHSNGTATNPITVQAENERRAFISGDGVSKPINVMYCSYWSIIGIRAKSADLISGAGGVMQVYQSDFITVRRMLLEHPNRYVNDHALILWSEVGSHGNHLVEENEIYDVFRHAIITKYEANSVFRRNYINSRGSLDVAGGIGSNFTDRGDSGICIYPGSNHIVENNISEGNGAGFDIQPEGLSNNNRFFGNISINDAYGTMINGRENKATNTYYEHFLVLNPSNIGMYLRGAENSRVVNARVENARLDGILADFPSMLVAATPSTHLTNVLSMNNGGTGVSLSNQNPFTVNYASSFGNKAAYAPAAPNAALTNIFTAQPTNLGTNKTALPLNSNLKAAGLSKADIGVNITNRYQNGVLQATALWDAATGEFACGAIVVGVNDIKGASCFDVNTRLGVPVGSGPVIPETRDDPPTIIITTQQTDGTMISGNVATVGVIALDDKSGNVARLELWLGSELINVMSNVAGLPDFNELQLRSRVLSLGDHVLKVVACDKEKNCSESSITLRK